MIRIELPKPIDHMTERENKKYARALKSLWHAMYVNNDNKTSQEICTKFNLKILNNAE